MGSFFILLFAMCGGHESVARSDLGTRVSHPVCNLADSIEFFGRFGGKIEWAVTDRVAEGRLLRAAIQSDHQAGLSRARKVYVEGLDNSGNVIWSRKCRLATRPVTRRSLLKRKATLTCVIPLDAAEKSLRICID